MKKQFKIHMTMEKGNTIVLKAENLHTMQDIKKEIEYFENTMNVGFCGCQLVEIKLAKKTIAKVEYKGILKCKAEYPKFC